MIKENVNHSLIKGKPNQNNINRCIINPKCNFTKTAYYERLYASTFNDRLHVIVCLFALVTVF